MDRRGFTNFLASASIALGAIAGAALGAPRAQAQSLAEVLSEQPLEISTQAATGDALFGTFEITSASLQALPQWRRILDHLAADAPAMADCMSNSANCANNAARSWRKLQVFAADLDHMEKLHAVNQFFNRWPYKSDEEAYGRREFWAPPSIFMTRSGDCEDYAIAKYFALRQMGFSKDELRIVVLWDRIRNVGHAVLAVYQADDILILDSLSNFITTHTRYRHYIPQYSMNETTRWAHVDHNRAIPQTALRASDN